MKTKIRTRQKNGGRKMNLFLMFLPPFFCLQVFLLAGAGCRKPAPAGGLVLTQSPARAAAAAAADVLDLRYPPGSRVVLAAEPFDPRRVQVLSQGLAAAGDPLISYDGRRICFVGKAGATSDWQVYEAGPDNDRPRALTSMPGGAMSPALLPDGALVFASPVPRAAGTSPAQPPSALYAQSPGGPPRRLTFGAQGAAAPTMLLDGRILFVFTGRAPADPLEPAGPASGPALFTINNDGTEVSAFAGRKEPGAVIERPRELPDGRVVYLVSKGDALVPGGRAEAVRLARPFQSCAPLFSGTDRIRAVQPANNGDLLVCAAGASAPGSSLALFRISSTAPALGVPLVADPAWNSCEAVEMAPHPRPMGRLSSMDPAKQTGQVLCLDANYTSYALEPGGTNSAVDRVRVLAERPPGVVCALGEVRVQADGSFMARVPANVPLGFEALDEAGRLLRREAPMLWVRPGENRSCIGCHEPRNHSPHNHRSLALDAPVPRLGLENAALAGPAGNRPARPRLRSHRGSPQGFGVRQPSGAFAPPAPGSKKRQRTAAVQNASRPRPQGRHSVHDPNARFQNL